MDSKKKRIVIYGDGETARLAYEYFSQDSPYQVVALCVEKKYFKRDSLFGLPVIPFEELENHFPPMDFRAFVAISHTRLNRVRTKFYKAMKQKGYRFVSYISSKAFVWRDAKIGENCFIFENSVVQSKVDIGNNVLLWSGSYVGHQTKIHDNCYVAPNVTISGFCEIGKNCFLGANGCINDTIKIGKECIIGSGAVVIRDAAPRGVYVGNPAKQLSKSSHETFVVSDG